MNSIIFSLFIFFILNNYVNSQAPDSCFRAAVYEHVIVIDPIDQPLKLLNDNLGIFERVTKKAAKYNVNILIFPEYGIIPQLEKNDTLGKGVAAFIPDLNTNLCKRQSKVPKNETTRINEQVVANNFILEKLSCIAAENNMHIAVDLVELEKNLHRTNSSLNNQNDEYLLYNALIVFDNKGSLIAKYRKYNLFGELAMVQEKEPRISTFQNEYGMY